MTSFLSRWLAKAEDLPPLQPGIYHYQSPGEAAVQYRLHLRVDPEEYGVLIVNAATVLHLNPTATAHALQMVQGASADEAAKAIADRYRVGRRKARRDHVELRDRIHSLATNPDVDPVFYLGIDLAQPFAKTPTAPYRLDMALTYALDPDGHLDPLASSRVDRELSTEEWEHILSLAWEAGIPHVAFTGGEPTRREDLLDLVTFAEQLGMVTGVLTEGRRLASKAYVDSLSQAGLDHLLIALRPQDSESLDGLRNALDSDVYTAVHLTLTNEFKGQIGEWLTRLEGMGVPAVSLTAAERTDEMKARLAEAREFAADLNLDLVWDLPAPYSDVNPISLELESVPAGAGKAWLYVEPDGDVLPTQGAEQDLGNLLRDGWDAVWERAKSV